MVRIQDGRAQVFLNALNDPRFRCRKRSIPASINLGVVVYDTFEMASVAAKTPPAIGR